MIDSSHVEGHTRGPLGTASHLGFPTALLTYLLAIGLLVALPDPASAQENVGVEQVYTSLSFTRPVDFDAGPDGHVYLTQQSGEIVRFPDEPAPTGSATILDISERVLDYDDYNEAGLLGLALHPSFSENRTLFVYYVTRGPTSEGTDTLHSVLSRFRMEDGNPDQVDLSSETRLLEIPQPTPRHNGGGLAFGPNGYLFLSLGEGSRGADAFDQAQDRSTLLGSVLRIDVDDADAGRAYGIPASNPYVGNEEGYREEIYAYGLRNPWQLTVDAKTGQIWVGDVGEFDFEEINLIEKGGNYGWPIVEGRTCFPPDEPQDCDPSKFASPVYVYRQGREVGRCVTGGYVYRGDELPELQGKYVFGDWASGNVWALDYEAGQDTTISQISIPDDAKKNPSTFGFNTEGELHFASSFHGVTRFVSDEKSSPGDDETPSDGDDEDEPKTTGLEVTGPNPAFSGTTVTYRVAQTGRVRVELYDLLGRRVQILLDRRVSAGSAGTVRVSTAELTAGTYLIRMRTGGVQRTRTVHVVR